RVPLRERAASRADQPHRPRRGAERSRRNGSSLPLLFRRVRGECRPLDASLHGGHRPLPQVDRLSIAHAQRPHDVGSNLRHGLTAAERHYCRAMATWYLCSTCSSVSCSASPSSTRTEFSDPPMKTLLL